MVNSMSDDEDDQIDYSEVIISNSEAEDRPNDGGLREKIKKYFHEKCTESANSTHAPKTVPRGSTTFGHSPFELLRR